MRHPAISGVRVVINPAHRVYYDEHTAGLHIDAPVDGGATRQESVRLGLASFADNPPDYILIHDAARPNISDEIISQVVAGLESSPAVIPVLPVFDTLKHVEDGLIVGTIERKKLFRAQTPQGFHYKAIFNAHSKCGDYDYTDDAAVAENMGLEVKTVTGSEHNYKITTAEDMRDAQSLLAAHYETRVGSGFDVHKLVPFDADMNLSERKVTICGTDIPFDFVLEGHSDADVGLHALVDAMLGAISAGDIGEHFPPSDPRWRGVSSSRFLIHAYQLLKQKRGSVVHIDITIICEKPAISPYREQMVRNIANLLDIEPTRVSVKATTTEKLGFTGRGEGIAAQAIVTVKVPGA